MAGMYDQLHSTGVYEAMDEVHERYERLLAVATRHRPSDRMRDVIRATDRLVESAIALGRVVHQRRFNKSKKRASR